MRNAFVDSVIEAAAFRDDLFIISGDAGLGVFDTFKEQHPDHYLNLGIAEQNTISFAAGLAMAGFKVMIYNIIPFVLYRCYEQVRNDICYQDLPVILAGIGSGLTYSPQGLTHYSIEDIAIARTLPNLAVISPIDPIEARLAARFALDSGGPVYVRLAKRGEPNIHVDDAFSLTDPQVLRKGSRIALLCHGSITGEVLKAYQELEALGIPPRVVSVPVLQPLNAKALLSGLEKIEVAVSVEEHYADGGLGTILSETIAGEGIRMSLIRMGVPNRFIHEIYDTAGMREYFGISSRAIVQTVLGLYTQKGAEQRAVWAG